MYDIIKNSDFQFGATLTINIPKDDIDKKALYTLMDEKPEFLIPFKYRNIDDVYEFTYYLEDNSRLLHTLGKKETIEYLDLWNKLLNPLFLYSDWFLKIEAFIFDFDYLYYNIKSGNITYIYLPTKKEISTRANLKDMITNFAKKNETNDKELENDIIWAISDFNIIKLRNLIKNKQRTNIDKPKTTEIKISTEIKDKHIEEKNIDSAKVIVAQNKTNKEVFIKKQQEEWQGSYKQEDKIIVKDDKSEIKINLGGAKDKSTEVSSGEKKKLFGKKIKKEAEKEKRSKNKINLFGKKENIIQVSQDVSLMEEQIKSFENNYNNIADGVTMLDDDIAEGTYLMSIGHINLIKIINIDINIDNIFTIGRVDITKKTEKSSFEFPENTKAISRKHALIERKVDGYYLTDIGSAAGTYINSKKLPTHTEFKISQGDKISFGTSGADYIWNES